MEEELDIIVNPIDPVSFELQNYSPADEKLIASSNLDTSFSDDTDYIEFYIYDQNGNLFILTLCAIERHLDGVSIA